MPKLLRMIWLSTHSVNVCNCRTPYLAILHLCAHVTCSFACAPLTFTNLTRASIVWLADCDAQRRAKKFLVLGHIENAGNASPKLIVSQSLHTDNIVLLDIQKITLDMIQVIMAPSLENSLTRASYSPRSKNFSRLLKK